MTNLTVKSNNFLCKDRSCCLAVSYFQQSMLAMTSAQGAALVQPAGHGAPAVQLTYITVEYEAVQKRHIAVSAVVK